MEINTCELFMSLNNVNNKKYRNVGKIPKSNIHIVKSGKIYTHNT